MLKLKLSKNLLEYKAETERIAGKGIEIMDRKKSKNWRYKPRAFVENDQIFIDPALKQQDLEESLFHELTHIYFRYNGYPSVTPKTNLTLLEQEKMDKTLSLVEDIFVDKFLEERNYTFEKYDYKTEIKKIIDIDKAGKYLSVGQKKNFDLELLLIEMLLLRLQIDPLYEPKDAEVIKNITVKNIGEDLWYFLAVLSKGIRDIFGQPIANSEKAYKAFKFLLKKYDLKGKITVRA